MYIPWHCRLSRGNCNGTQRLVRGFIIIIVIAIIGISIDILGNITIAILRISSIIISIISINIFCLVWAFWGSPAVLHRPLCKAALDL